MHHLFGDQQFAIDQPAQLAKNFLDALAQLGGLQQVGAHFLVVAEGSAAMHQRVVITVRQALCPCGNIGLVKIAQKHGRQALDVADA